LDKYMNCEIVRFVR